MNDKLLANVRLNFARVVYSMNCHYFAYNRLQKTKKHISRFVIMLASVTLILLISQIISLQLNIITHENRQTSEIILSIISFVGLLLTGASIVFQLVVKDDFMLEMFNHKMYVEKYKSLRDEHINLVQEIMSNSTTGIQLIVDKEIDLQKRYFNMRESAPILSPEDDNLADERLGLNKKQATWSDDEIDKLLPEQYRILHDKKTIGQ